MSKIELSEHFTYGKLLRYSLPSIGNMLVITSFQVIDGLFVSNLLGVKPFAAVDLIYPIVMVLQAVGFMFGARSSALVSKVLGKGEEEKARQYFTMSIMVLVVVGAVLGAISALLMPWIAGLVGATESTLPFCIDYGRTLVCFLPAFLINAAFQTLWITAGKTTLGLCVSILYGASNALMDWLFMGVFDWKIRGAALATSLASLISASIILIYFFLPNKSKLRFVTFEKSCLKDLGGMLYNGSSEMVEGIAGNFTAILTNRQLLRYIGEIGVTGLGVFNFVMSVIMSVFYGISTTTVTVVGYNAGRKDRREIGSILKKDIVLNIGLGGAMAVLVSVLARPLASLYLGYEARALETAVTALQIGSLACLLYGFDIVSSSFFTGLGDGTASALVAVVLALAAPVLTIYALPAIFGAGAIWYAIPCNTVLAAAVCLICLRTRYPKTLAKL